MTVARFVRSLLMAPVYGVLCLVVGMLFSWLIIAVNLLIHLVSGAIGATVNTIAAQLAILLVCLV